MRATQHHPRPPLQVLVALVAGVLVLTSLSMSTADGAPPAAPPTSGGDEGARAGELGIARGERVEALGAAHERSDDVIVHANGDRSGLHVLVARESSGYAWSTLATLSEPGLETDRWIGNACVTGDARSVAVVYAPRTATNSPTLMQRGGFGAVVDLADGSVTKLPFGSTLAHYNPGCGADETVAFSQYAGMDRGRDTTRTQLQVVDATTGRVERRVRVPGQLASAVPVGDVVVAAQAKGLVRIDEDGRRSRIRSTASVPSSLVASGDDQVAFVETGATEDTVRTIDDVTSRPRAGTLTRAPAGTLELGPGLGDRPVVLGEAPRSADAAVVGIPKEGVLATSTLGHAVLVQDPTPRPYLDDRGKRVNPAWTAARTVPVSEDGTTSVRATLRVVASGFEQDQVIEPRADLVGDSPEGADPAPWGPAASVVQGPAPASSTSPGVAQARTASSVLAASTTDTIDQQATCAVPRNDPRSQVYQPTPRQVEWAVNQAVAGNLTVTRPANWKRSGISTSWSPQGLIPRRALSGGGTVPSQVLLGILSQESNLWQASGHSLPGVPGNPLIGNYYGNDVYNDTPVDDFDVDFADADCGYGLAQVTDNMRKNGSRSALEKRAIALDYATNIAAGLDILIQKWNQSRADGVVHDNGKPASLENWVFAIWAYNSGFYPESQAPTHLGAWGVGWLNNPANPLWKSGRHPFLDFPSDAAHPQDWSYAEKVIGFAGQSIATPDGPGFRPAWWVNERARSASQPDEHTFCNASNSCDFGTDHGSDYGPCGRSDYRCWWNRPTSYQTCSQGYCGNALERFDATYPEQPDGTKNPPACSTSGLPSNVRIVDDVPASAPPISTSTRPCAPNVAAAGTFTLDMPESAPGVSPARIDLHQSGAGFGGHVWWTHTRAAPRHGVELRMSGTWAFADAVNGWARVMVHVPDYAAHTRQAAYVVHTGTKSYTRHLPQRRRVNGWVSLGVFKFSAAPRITLSSHTGDGNGSQDIAWDAMAVQPLPAKPRHLVVALGDSYISGEGASVPATVNGKTDNGASYYKDTDYGGALSVAAGRNACHRSRLAWPRKMTLPGLSTSLGAASDAWSATADLQLHACSGAVSGNVDDYAAGGVGRFGELPQIDKGYLDENTTLVLLSIGGNDAGFSDVITSCVVPWNVLGCDETQSGLEAKVRGPVRAAIVKTVKRVRLAAPNAKIMLMGYPVIVAPGADGRSCWDIDDAEIRFLEDIVRRVVPEALAGVKADLASSGISITVGSPVPELDGRGACGSPEHIRGLVNDATEGDEPDIGNLPLKSAQSFHPNPAGTDGYGAAATRVAAGMGL